MKWAPSTVMQACARRCRARGCQNKMHDRDRCVGTHPNPDLSRRGFLLAGGGAIASLAFPAELPATLGKRGDPTANAAARFPYFQSEPVSYLHVRMQDTFWAPRQRITHSVSVPWITQAHDRSGGLTQFKKNPKDYVAQTRLGGMEH